MTKISIDNFFADVDSIRNLALSMSYKKSSNNTGWKGYRVSIKNLEIGEYIKKRLIGVDKKFENLLISELFFHYSLEDTKDEMKDFLKERLHKDLTQLAGVIYLAPNPKEKSGTALYFEDGKIETFENVYNRFIMYDGNVTHGPEDTFGDSIENGRLTMTIFASLDKNDKTLI